MPRCIAPGCTSGYDSNPEKLHFFCVPKNDEMVTQWHTALRRKNFVVKTRQAVCQKHFIQGDIIWFKEFRDLQGIVVARARYLRPRLRKGAVPVIFPWYEPPRVSEDSPAPSNQLEEINIEVEKENEELIPSSCDDSSVLTTSEETCKEEPSILENQDESISSVPATDEPSEDITPLYKVLEDENVRLPRSWTKNIVTYGEIRVPWFTQSTCIKDNEIYVPIILKELFLQPNMEARVQVLGIKIDLESIGVEKMIDSKEAVEKTLSHLNLMNVCCGCPLPDDLKKMKCHITYEDTRGSLRHVACPMLSKSIQCTFCAKVRKTLVRRRSRLKYRETQKLERLRLMKLSSEQRNKAMKNSHRILKTTKVGGNKSKLKIESSKHTHD